MEILGINVHYFLTILQRLRNYAAINLRSYSDFDANLPYYVHFNFCARLHKVRLTVTVAGVYNNS